MAIEERIKHKYLTGSTKNRQKTIEKFNNDETIPIFSVSLKAGRTGLNLTEADLQYIFSID